MEKIFKTYNGGKNGNGTFQNIINNIPKCTHFIEVFGGSCAISRNIILPCSTVINDIDRSIYIKLLELSKHLQSNVVVENESYSHIIDKYDVVSCNTFFYMDPPYLFSTRKSGKKLYNYEFSDDDHVNFLTMANKVKSNCMISHYPCELYDTYLKDWRTFDFESSTRHGMRTERIYMNYQQPENLQDYRYVGANYIHRQQIKRKISRWIKNIDEMETYEKKALLSAIIAKYAALI